ncbi:MAG: hypothetical protein WCP36_03910 [Methanomicrobiales archaeon]
MQSILPGHISFIPAIVLIIAIAAILLILLFMKMYQVKQATRKKDHPGIWNVKAPKDIITPLPDIPEINRRELPVTEHPAVDIPLTDLGDITKNLHALVSKYHLDAITLSTTDGLMIATTSENGQDDAAHYGHILKPGEVPSVPDIRLFFITHKGSSIVGIIRYGLQVTDSLLERITNDTEKIMNWWI